MGATSSSSKKSPPPPLPPPLPQKVSLTFDNFDKILEK